MHFVFVGKTQFPDLDSAIRRYLDRLSHYVPVAVHRVKPERIVPGMPEDMLRNREGERILKLVPKPSHLLVWDENGTQLDSRQMSAFLDRLRREGQPEMWMVLGGPLGVSPRLRAEASSVFSLSRMTFPHDIARLLVVEQVYRAFTILRGEPYHK